MSHLYKLFVLLIFAKFLYKCTSFDNIYPDDEIDFTLLVEGGYRPVSKALTQFLCSLRKDEENASNFGRTHFCTCTIVSPIRVITAASCFDNNNWRDTVIVSGNPLLFEIGPLMQTRKIKKFSRHPNYIEGVQHYDIALLEFREELIRTEDLDFAVLTEAEPRPGVNCTLLGWGSLIKDGPIANDPVYADMTILPHLTCIDYWKHYYSKGMLCAMNNVTEVQACTGDLGAPLFFESTLAGILTFDTFCSIPDYPNVFINLYYYRDFIMRGGGKIARLLFILIVICEVVHLIMSASIMYNF